MKDTMIVFLMFSFAAAALPAQRNTVMQPESSSPAIIFEVTAMSLGKPVSGLTGADQTKRLRGVGLSRLMISGRRPSR